MDVDNEEEQTHYVLLHAETDELDAANIQEKLKGHGFKGSIRSDILPGEFELEASMKLVQNTKIVFILVTDNFVSDKMAILVKDEVISNNLAYPTEWNKQHIIPMFLKPKRDLRLRFNVEYAGLMSKSGININDQYFDRKIEVLKGMVGLYNTESANQGSKKPKLESGGQESTCVASVPTEPAAVPMGLSSDICPSDVQIQMGDDSGKVILSCDTLKGTSGTVNTGGSNVQSSTANVSPASMESGDSSDIFVANGAKQRNGSDTLGNIELRPSFVFKLIQAFQRLKIEDMSSVTEKMCEYGILTTNEHKMLPITHSKHAGEIKDALLTKLIEKSDKLTHQHISKFARALDNVTQPCNSQRKYKSTLRCLSGLLQLKIQDIKGLIDALWSVRIISPPEREECERSLENQGEIRATQCLIRIMLEQEEASIKDFFQALELGVMVSMECRRHIDHTLEAYGTGQTLPGCCLRLNVLTADGIDKALSGPYQKSLRKHMIGFKSNVNQVKEVIDSLLSKLVLNQSHYERLGAVKTESDKAALLVQEIYKLDDEQVKVLIEVLRASSGANPTLASKLEATARELSTAGFSVL